MALSDYLNGPTYRKRVQGLESKLTELQERYTRQLAEFQERSAPEIQQSKRAVAQGSPRQLVATPEA